MLIGMVAGMSTFVIAVHRNTFQQIITQSDSDISDHHLSTCEVHRRVRSDKRD